MEDVRNDDGTKFMYLVDQLTKQYHHMTEILYEKTNNYSVDMKFFKRCFLGICIIALLLQTVVSAFNVEKVIGIDIPRKRISLSIKQVA